MGLQLTPAGRLRWEPSEDEAAPAGPPSLQGAFETDWREALFTLAAEKTPIRDMPSVRYWQQLAEHHLTGLCHVPEDVGSFEVEPLTTADCARWILTAPPMPGGEYLGEETLQRIWEGLDGWVRETAARTGGLAAFLRERAPKWHQVGRVCKKGRDIQPIEIEGRAVARSFRAAGATRRQGSGTSRLHGVRGAPSQGGLGRRARQESVFGRYAPKAGCRQGRAPSCLHGVRGASSQDSLGRRARQASITGRRARETDRRQGSRLASRHPTHRQMGGSAAPAERSLRRPIRWTARRIGRDRVSLGSHARPSDSARPPAERPDGLQPAAREVRKAEVTEACLGHDLRIARTVNPADSAVSRSPWSFPRMRE